MNTQQETQATWEQKVHHDLRINPDGSWVKVKEIVTPVDPSAVFAQVLKEIGWLSPMFRPGSYVYFMQDTTIVLQRVLDIPFKIEMVVDPASIPTKEEMENDSENKKVVRYMPVFDASKGIDINPPFRYVPPQDMRLWFITETREGSDPFLLAQCALDGTIHHPILPNIYDNGRVCMGQAQIPVYHADDGLSKFLNSIFESWSEAKWNSDLLGANGARPIEWLKFDEKTKTNVIPDDGHWKEYAGPPITPPFNIGMALQAIHNKFREERGGC